VTQNVLLDIEAVQALGHAGHTKHRRVVSHLQVVAQRKKRAMNIKVSVPTPVRVEAGWDRTARSWAFANQLRISDEALDTGYANAAAALRRKEPVSVADAHLGAVIGSIQSGQIAVVTSDPRDIATVAGARTVTIVAI
jgi:predicted nucleic acid-binding protein